MIVYFADRNLNILGTANTDLPEGIKISSDSKVEEVENGSTSFSFTLDYDSENLAEIKKLIAVGNYVLTPITDSSDNIQEGIECEFYTIINTEKNTSSSDIDVYAEDDGLELLNGIAEEFIAVEAHPAAWYFNKWLDGTGYEIGTNDITNLSRTLGWIGSSTITKRLLSIANAFDDAEISFTFKVSSTNQLMINKKLVNIHSKRGSENGIVLTKGIEVDEIHEERDISELYTCLVITGGYPETDSYDEYTEPITLAGYTYDDGTYYLDSDGKLYSRTGIEKWKSATSNGIIVGEYSYDTDSQSELLNRSLSYIKAYDDEFITYEVTLNDYQGYISPGDTVTVVDPDEDFYLTARALTITTSRTDRTYKITLGDFSRTESTINEQVKELAEEFKNLQKSQTLYTWYVYADSINGDGISTDPIGKSYLGIAGNRITKSADISDPSIFTWSLIKGGDGIPGTNGYIHIAYSNSADGSVDFSKTNSTGRNYIGIYTDDEETSSDHWNKYTWSLIKGEDGKDGRSVISITTQYYLSTSNTELIGGEWSDSVPAYISADGYIYSEDTSSLNSEGYISGLTATISDDYISVVTALLSSGDPLYYWERTKVTYLESDGVTYTTEYSDGVLSTALNKAVHDAEEAKNNTETILDKTVVMTKIQYRLSLSREVCDLDSMVVDSVDGDGETLKINSVWQDTFPDMGMYAYVWTRVLTMYADGTSEGNNEHVITDWREFDDTIRSYSSQIKALDNKITAEVVSTIDYIVNTIEGDTDENGNTTGGITNQLRTLESELASLGLTSDSIKGYVERINALEGKVETSTAELTLEGLTVDTDGDGSGTKTLINSQGMQVKDSENNSLLEVTLSGTVIDKLTVRNEMFLSNHYAVGYDDTEWNGSTVHGTGWLGTMS